MAKLPSELLCEIKKVATKANNPECLTISTLPAGEVKITAPALFIPECERTTRSSSSNSASSDTPATHNGSSWDTDREESNPLEPETRKITLSTETSQFLPRYFDQIYSQLQNTLLNIDIIEETVEWQLKNYVSEAIGIDPSLITSDEIVLFTTEEIKTRSRRIADQLIKSNQAKRDLCPLEFYDQSIQLPEKYHPPMKELLTKIEKLYFEKKDEETILKELGYKANESNADTQENVMAFLDPESKPKQPSIPPHTADTLKGDFVEYDINIVVYQCLFCKKKGLESEGHWEPDCPLYKREHRKRSGQRLSRNWEEAPPPPAPVMSQPPSDPQFYYPPGVHQQPQFFPPVIYPFQCPPMYWQQPHPAMLDQFTPQHGYQFMFAPPQHYPPPPQNRHHRRRHDRRRKKENVPYFGTPRNRCVLCNGELPRHELRCPNKPVNQSHDAASVMV